MKKQKRHRSHGQLVPVIWDGAPDYYMVYGHVTEEECYAEVERETGRDLRGMKVYHDYARIGGIGVFLFTRPGQRRTPVTVCYISELRK